ncbi:ribokinase [Oceanobacillus sp. FSL W7-1293]|uniref:ribokinase n=1 Tax=Oceanobacillus sp. FSL W7-1293 TaxID=2921699 RepID=UPI0030CC1B85
MRREPIITVIGSINMDLVVSVDRKPNRGETVKGESFDTLPGGKGANQAIALARLGATVNMIGMVGDDAFGHELKSNLEKENVQVEAVGVTAGISTGVAVITIAENDNSIAVVSGANEKVTPAYIREYEKIIKQSDIVLTQFEVPISTVEEAAMICEKHGIPIVLNPAPFEKLSDSLLDKVTYLTPNQHEYELIKGYKRSFENDYQSKLIITKGEVGAVFFENEKPQIVSAFTVKPIDTTGAGDTFNSAFTYMMTKTNNIEEACRFSNAAAALSVLKRGAQLGMPTKEEVNSFLSEQQSE